MAITQLDQARQVVEQVSRVVLGKEQEIRKVFLAGFVTERAEYLSLRLPQLVDGGY